MMKYSDNETHYLQVHPTHSHSHVTLPLPQSHAHPDCYGAHLEYHNALRNRSRTHAHEVVTLRARFVLHTRTIRLRKFCLLCTTPHHYPLSSPPSSTHSCSPPSSTHSCSPPPHPCYYLPVPRHVCHQGRADHPHALDHFCAGRRHLWHASSREACAGEADELLSYPNNTLDISVD